MPAGSRPTSTLATQDEQALVLPTPFPPPTRTQHSPLHPRAPSEPCQVVIDLKTSMVVEYASFYPDVPIASWTPKFRSYPDGTLVAPPFHQDLKKTHFNLFITSFLLALFLRNIVVTAIYCYKGKVKKKLLFYLLLASQVLAPLSILPIMVSFFMDDPKCTVVLPLSYGTATVSIAILITGIWGMKAYKCLENPRILLYMLGALQVSALVFVGLDIANMETSRRLSSSCIQTNDPKYTRHYATIQCLQAFLVFLCFVYACWKSHKSPASRGRMSIRLSMDDVRIPISPIRKEAESHSRGWWDWVPKADSPDARPAPPMVEENFEPKVSFGDQLDRPSNFVPILGKGEQRGRYRPYPYTSTLSRNRLRNGRSEEGPDSSVEMLRPNGSQSPTFSKTTGSSLRRFNRMFAGRHLFRQVMKDELLYTTFIMSTCVVTALMPVIGLNTKTPLTVVGWITVNWAIMSLLTVHSFGRVVQRHERESWIQRSAARNQRIATTVSARSSFNRATMSERRSSSIGPLLNSRPLSSTTHRRISEPRDPFADPHSTSPEMGASWRHSGYSNMTLSPTTFQGFELKRRDS